jgi:secreted trypsin-like serine protease
MAGMLVGLAIAVFPAGVWAHKQTGNKPHARSRPHGTPVYRHRVNLDRAHAAIVGGHFANNGQFPWVARIVAHRGKVIVVCTGTVVAPILILTAGHCAEDLQTGVPLEPSDYEVQTRAYFAGRPASQSSRVSRVLIYPGFERSSGVGDAALLELSTATTAPSIRLAGEADESPVGTPAVMTGWGRTNGATRAADRPFLHWASTVVQDPEWCAGQVRGFHARRQLCVMNSPSDNTAGCAGDSGGPLLVKRAGSTIEIGVLNGSAFLVRGSKVVKCVTTAPTVFARAGVLSRWIDEWIQRATSVALTVTEAAPHS